MKQELSPAVSKVSSYQHSPSPATRARVARTRESTNEVSLSPGSKQRPKPSSPSEANNTARSRKSFLVSKPKPAGDSMETPNERQMGDSKITGRPAVRSMEQYARLQRAVDTDCKGSEYETDGKVKNDLQRRINVSEGMVKDLQSEVSSLKAQLEKLQSLNIVLESQNKQLTNGLSAAEAKIKELEGSDQVEPNSKGTTPPEFKDVRELIAKKLDMFRGKKEIIKENKPSKIQSVAPEPGAKSVGMQPKLLFKEPLPPPSHPVSVTRPPPPPPPPPPRSVPLRSNTMQKATSLVDFYHSLTKRDVRKDPSGSGNCSSPGANNVHNSIVDELQNRSAHLLAIKADVEKKGDFINHLITKVQYAAFTDIEDVLTFVDWLDGKLSVLADERAVLKHFNWPERKADALREAAFEYRDLKQLQTEVSSFEDDVLVPCEASLKKIASLLDKLERSIQRLIRLRETTKISYKDCKIPTDWMLDSGMVSKIKLASVKLANIFMKRVSTELELARQPEKESVQEALLYQGVHFAYRTYQFAGGLDSETMRAFEDLRARAQLHRRIKTVA